jgi:hypothetical protein
VPPRPNFRAFVYGYNLTDVTITGGGIIHGHGDFWWSKGKKVEYNGQEVMVPNLLHLVGCNNVKISGVGPGTYCLIHHPMRFEPLSLLKSWLQGYHRSDVICIVFYIASLRSLPK